MNFDPSNIVNKLSNTPISITKKYTIEELINWRGKRYEGFEETAGFAANDAFVIHVPEKHETFERLAKAIMQIINTKDITLIELGSGEGCLVYHFDKLGWHNYIAVDGNPLIMELSDFANKNKDKFKILNLQDEIDFAYKFDLILSFEVIEHIKEEFLDNFIKTVLNCMHKESIFIITCSLQSGLDVHVTVKPRQWWLEKFSSYGLKECGTALEYKILFENHPFNWNKKHTNLFILKQ